MTEIRFPPIKVPRPQSPAEAASGAKCGCLNCTEPSVRGTSRRRQQPPGVTASPTARGDVNLASRVCSLSACAQHAKTPAVEDAILEDLAGEASLVEVNATRARKMLKLLASAHVSLLSNPPIPGVNPGQAPDKFGIPVKPTHMLPPEPKEGDSGGFDADEPSPNHVPGTMTVLQYPPRDNTPPYKSHNISVTSKCGSARTNIIADLHTQAYAMFLLGLRTTKWILQLNEASQRTYWEWGLNSSKWSFMWGRDPDARYSSLWWWFGSYSRNKLINLRDALDIRVRWIEQGRAKYRCVDSNQAVDTFSMASFNQQVNNVRMHPPFWANQNISVLSQTLGWGGAYTINTTWSNRRVATFIHEWMHFRNVEDHQFSAACLNAFDYGYSLYGYCGRDVNGDRDWKYRLGPNRSLAASANANHKAILNNDSYVSWLLARFVDPQWGLSNGPRVSPFGIIPAGLTLDQSKI